MDINLLNLIKETLETSKNKQDEIEKVENTLKEKAEKYKEQDKVFNEQYLNENSNNPAYEDIRKIKQKELEEQKIDVSKEQESLNKMREEFEQNFQSKKVEILEQVSTAREQLKQEYDEKKAEPEKKLQELQKQKEDAEKSIEYTIAGIEYAKKSGYTDALDAKEKRLEDGKTLLANINKEIEELNNRDFDKEFREKIAPDFEKQFNVLSEIEDVLRQPYTTKSLIEGLNNVYEKSGNENEKEKPEVNSDANKNNSAEDIKKQEPVVKTGNNGNNGNNGNVIKNSEMAKKPFTVNKVVDFDKKTGKPIFATNLEEVPDIKLQQKNSKKDEIKKAISVNIKISPNGVPMYEINYINGDKKTVTIPTEISLKAQSKDIVKEIKNYTNNDILDSTIKKIDPFLISALGLNQNDSKTIMELVNDGNKISDIDIKYDMQNMKKMSIGDRSVFKKIMRNAEKIDGITVENFKDDFFHRLIKGDTALQKFIKNKISNNSLTAKENTKALGTGKNGHTNAMKEKVIVGYMSVDSKIDRKFTEVQGKMKSKIDEMKDKRLLNKQAKVEKRLEKINKEVASRINEQNFKNSLNAGISLEEQHKNSIAMQDEMAGKQQKQKDEEKVVE